VRTALRCGYKLIDTATIYKVRLCRASSATHAFDAFLLQNEQDVGEALSHHCAGADASATHSVFITSKVSPYELGYDKCLGSVKVRSIEGLHSLCLLQPTRCTGKHRAARLAASEPCLAALACCRPNPTERSAQCAAATRLVAGAAAGAAAGLGSQRRRVQLHTASSRAHHISNIRRPCCQPSRAAPVVAAARDCRLLFALGRRRASLLVSGSGCFATQRRSYRRVRAVTLHARAGVPVMGACERLCCSAAQRRPRPNI